MDEKDECDENKAESWDGQGQWARLRRWSVNVQQSSAIERLRFAEIVGFRFDDRTRRIDVDNISERVQLLLGNHDRSLKSIQ